MTRLSIHPDTDAGFTVLSTQDPGQIAEALHARGIRFERPELPAGLPQGDAPATRAACQGLVERECARWGYTVVDAVSVTPDTDNLPALRGKFLSEHTHAEDEARLMTEGAGTFYLRHQGEVLIVELHAGDLISVPTGMRHWFDMGERPRFTALRFFTRPDGWVGAFTGDPIAERFPRYAGAA